MSNSFPYRMVVFDLDGTLIDSAPSILQCFDAVLQEAGIQPALPLDTSLIGPPLRQTLMNLTGLPAGEEIERLAGRFPCFYDSAGYRLSRVYPGVEELLAVIASHGVPMAIATNKRRAPALKIVEHLGWLKYFPVVGTLDDPAAPQPDKAALIGSILAAAGIAAKDACYLGDTYQDGAASAANGMRFFAATWGYGNWDAASLAPAWSLVASPIRLAELLTGESMP